MQFKIFDEPKSAVESGIDYWERLVADPVSLLPRNEKQELSFSSPVFVPIQQQQQAQMEMPQFSEESQLSDNKPKKKHEQRFRQ